MPVAEIVGLALAVAALLPMVKAGVDNCRSIRDAPRDLASFRADLETYHAILTTVKAATDEMSSRPADDQPELASMLSIAKQAWADCNATAVELTLVLERTTGRFQAYFRGGKLKRLHQRLTRRTVTLVALLQALDRLDKYYAPEKIVERYKDLFETNGARNPPVDPPPPYAPATRSHHVNFQSAIDWRRVGKIALWTILGAAVLTTAFYAVPFLITYFTGTAVATGIGVGAAPTAMLPWTAASYVSYATTLFSSLGSTAAASAAGTAVAAATTATTLSGLSTMSALGVTLLAQPAAAVLPASVGGIVGAIWGALK